MTGIVESGHSRMRLQCAAFKFWIWERGMKVKRGLL